MSDAFDTWDFEHEGRFYRAELCSDDSRYVPWEEEDGHGPVRETRDVREKYAGERVLHEERGWGQLYDFKEAVEIALRDGWGCAGGIREGETRRAYAARAAEADFKHLRRWCDDLWSYVGLVVTDLETHEDQSLWCIAYDPGSKEDKEYIDGLACELAGELGHLRQEAAEEARSRAEQEELNGWARLAGIKEDA